MNKKAQLKIQAGKNHRFLMPVFSIKAQLKIQEMAFMLVAVILFFALAGLFTFSIIYSNMFEQANKINEARTLSSITNLADSPEFNCVGSNPNCVDSDKLISLIGKSRYESFWHFSSLSVVKISGFNKSEDEMIKCSLANYPNCDMFNVYDKQVDNERVISSFVALCRKERENEYTYDKCEIAKLIAGTEIKVTGEE